MRNSVLIALYKQPQTVFTMKDISLMFPGIPYANLKKRMSDFARAGAIEKLRRGIYAKDNYNRLELANKLYAPSYISLETVLVKAAMIFQYYETVFAVSYLARTVQVGDQTIVYRKIKNPILLNKQGIEEENGVMIASPERAFLDVVFLYRGYHIDNLGPLDWEKVMDLKSIYNSKALNKRVDGYYQIYKEENA